MGRFKICITVYIDEENYLDSNDAEKRCSDFFHEFCLRHLNSTKFNNTSTGYNNLKANRDVTFIKRTDEIFEVESIIKSLKNVLSMFGEKICYNTGSPYIDKTELERDIKNVEYALTAYNLLKNL